MAKLASKHRTRNVCLPTSKNVFDLNHEMFENFGGGETSKQGQAVGQTMLVSFARPLEIIYLEITLLMFNL